MRTVDSHFGNHYHGRAIFERLRDKLQPVLEAADEIMPALADFREHCRTDRICLPGEVDAVFDAMPGWFEARAAIMADGMK